jgi:hypothetical protein
MAKPIWVKTSAGWKQGTNFYVKVGGAWKQCNDVPCVKVAGVWRHKHLTVSNVAASGRESMSVSLTVNCDGYTSTREMEFRIVTSSGAKVFSRIRNLNPSYPNISLTGPDAFAPSTCNNYPDQTLTMRLYPNCCPDHYIDLYTFKIDSYGEFYDYSIK